MSNSQKITVVSVKNNLDSFMSPHHPRCSSLLSDTIIGHPNEQYLFKLFFINKTQSFEDIEGVDNDLYLWNLYQTEQMFEYLDESVNFLGGIDSSDIQAVTKSSVIIDPYDTWIDIQALLIIDEESFLFESDIIDEYT